MVEMNKRILPRQKRRSRPPTPSRVSKTPPPSEEDMPPTLQAESTNHNEEQLPAFVSSSLPEEPPPPSLDKTPVDKLTSTSRKRERTPSPTYNTAKRPALSNSSLTKFTSSALPGSKITGGVKSYASKVLTEELQKQQGVENTRLKSLIVREVRKPGKSECACVLIIMPTDYVY